MYIVKTPIGIQDLAHCTDQRCGAWASFLGVVRNHNHGRQVRSLTYECYPSMAEKEIHRIGLEAKRRFGLSDVLIRHRVGRLQIGEVALSVAVSAPHRREAFEACRIVVDEIKRRVPIWKKEVYEDGSGEWVHCAPLLSAVA